MQLTQGEGRSLRDRDTPRGLRRVEQAQEAAKARDRKTRELHGECAYLNFPEELAQEAGTGDSQQGGSVAPDTGREGKRRKRVRRRYVNLSGTAVLHTSTVGTLSVIKREP
jgi:hypothetical protein